jgi:hypothetical protein
MNAQNPNVEVADRFAGVAQEFCSTVESASRIDRIRLLTDIYCVLPRLIYQAISLPSIGASEVDDPTPEKEQSLSQFRVRMTDDQWRDLYNLLKEKLRDWDLYWQVFDPTTDKEAACGSLADDLADIYRDLKDGLVLNEKPLTGPEEAIWQWRLLYHDHWGKHAIDALLVTHFRLQGIME